jgi:hypothetical protein
MSDFADRLNERRQADEATPAAKRRSQLPSDPPNAAASQEELAAWVTVALGLGGDPVAAATRYGRHPDSRMVITLKSEQRITFERQVDAFEPRKLVQLIIVSTGAEVPHYAAPDAQKIATAIIRLSELAAEDDERAEGRDWADSFLAAAARNVMHVATFATPAGRWEALSVLASWKAPADLPTWAPPAERAVIVRDASGRRLVRTSDVAAHVRGQIGRPISWPALHSRMIEIGWEHRGEIQQRQPNGHAKLKAHVYAVPAEWENE